MFVNAGDEMKTERSKLSDRRCKFISLNALLHVPVIEGPLQLGLLFRINTFIEEQIIPNFINFFRFPKSNSDYKRQKVILLFLENNSGHSPFIYFDLC